jgi:ADP-heptose:LPS heptosyltransferase
LRSIRAILVCQLRQIGDVLLATPSLELLAKRFPEAAIHVLTEKKCAPVLEGNPYVRRIWAIDKGEQRHLGRDLAFSWRVARQEYDLVVDFQQLPRCRWVVAFSGASLRLSYTPPWYNRPLYTHWIDPLPGYSAMAKASVLRPLGVEWRGERPLLRLTDAERGAAHALCAALGVGEGGQLVTLDPTHRRATREWPAPYFGKLAADACERVPGLKFLVLYGPGELDAAMRVRETALALGLAPERLVLPEQVIPLRVMAGVIERACMHLGNCSAPRHFAVAMRVPSFTVLGATSASWTFPSPEHGHIAAGLDCQPCNRNTCADVRCLTALRPETVLPAFLEHLAAHAKKR